MNKITNATNCMRYFTVIPLLLLLVLPASSARGAGPVIINDATERYSLGRNLDILKDKDGTLTVEKAGSAEYAALFKNSVKDIPNFGFSDSVYWARFAVRFPYGRETTGRTWILKYGWPFIMSVTMYVSKPGGGYEKTEFELLHPGEREIPYRLPLFRLKERPGETVTVYLRVRSIAAVLIPLTLVTERSMFAEMSLENSFNGAFFGIMLIMILYHLLLYLAVRNRDYIYFSLLVLAQIAVHMLNSGAVALDIPFQNERTFSFMYAFSLSTVLMLWALTFSRMLNLKRELPAFATILKITITALFLLSVSSYVLPLNRVWSCVFMTALCYTLFTLIAMIIRLKQGSDIAAYFIVITALDIATGFANALIRFDVVPLNWFTDHVRPLFAISQALILSYVITLRVRQMDQDRIQAQELSIRNLRRVELIKDEFLSNTSHELKTPLHGIVGISEVMLKSGREKLGAATRENLSLIAASGRRLLSLVNDILDFSSIRHGKPSIAIKPVDPRGAVSVVFSLLSTLVAGKAIELRNSVPERFAPVLADEERLKQILMNLTENAIKFTEYGVIEVSAATIDEGTAEISVSDTGPGIKPGDMERIFDSFEQGDGSASRSHAGVGLGLAISKKLVELQGGTIRAESSPGRGSTFTFTLQLAEAREADQAVARDFGGLETATALRGEEPKLQPEIHRGKPDGETHSILVADDDPLSVKVLFDYLSELGYRVDSAPDGFAALVKLKETRVDILLLDVMMPGLSGYEVLKKIRRLRSAEELPVILITAKSQIDEIKLGFNLGANDYVIKPFQLEEISHRIESILGLKHVIAQREPALMVKEKSESRLIPHKEIVYLSSSGKKTVIHTNTRKEVIGLLLKEVEVKLPQTFVRIHRQLILNTAYLSKVVHVKNGGHKAVLNDTITRLPVSRSYMSALQAYLERRGYEP